MQRASTASRVAISPPHDLLPVQAMLDAEQQRRNAARQEGASQQQSREHQVGRPSTEPTSGLQAMRFGPTNQLLTLPKAVQKCEAHGLAVLSGSGLTANLRRMACAAMQMPRASQELGSRVATASMENVPLGHINPVMLTAGWEKKAESKTHTEWVTDYPKALGQLLALETIKGVMGQAACKLHKPDREPKSKAVLAAIPPGRAIHRTREDKSEVFELVFHLGIVNEVQDHASPCCPAHSLYAVCSFVHD